MMKLSKQDCICKELFEDCVRSFCTVRETAKRLRVSENTLRSWSKNEYGKPLQEVFEELRTEGSFELRRMGMELASKNASVWIFLAKNFLGMSDTPVPLPDDTATDSLANAFKEATKSIYLSANLNGILIPSKDEEQ